MRGRRRISGGRVTIPRDGLGTWLPAEHMAKSGGGSNVLISLNMGSEGLLDYVAEVRREHGEGPLFPRLNPNRDGRRGDPASPNGIEMDAQQARDQRRTHRTKSFMAAHV